LAEVLGVELVGTGESLDDSVGNQNGDGTAWNGRIQTTCCVCGGSGVDADGAVVGLVANDEGVDGDGELSPFDCFEIGINVDCVSCGESVVGCWNVSNEILLRFEKLQSDWNCDCFCDFVSQDSLKVEKRGDGLSYGVEVLVEEPSELELSRIGDSLL